MSLIYLFKSKYYNMTLYFDGPGTGDDLFTISQPNLSGQYKLLLSSEYAHKLTPKDPDEVLPWSALDLTIVETNARYTTFKLSNNTYYQQIRDNFYNGVYNIKIGKAIGTPEEEYIYEGTVKLITAASQDATKNIKKYESDDETNSGYVFYSDRL